MEKKDVIAKLKTLSVGYKAELITFFEDYVMYTDNLCSRMSDGMARTVEQFAVYDRCTTEEAYMVRELCKWLQDAGFEKFLDQLFFIPGQFEKDLEAVTEAARSRILEAHISFEDKLTCSEYKFFNNKESFNRIPCFN